MFRERKPATTRAMAVSLPAEIFLNYRPVRCSTMQHQGPRGRGNSLHYHTQQLRGHIKILTFCRFFPEENFQNKGRNVERKREA